MREALLYGIANAFDIWTCFWLLVRVMTDGPRTAPESCFRRWFVFVFASRA